MNYLHYEFDLGPDDAVRVTLEGAANIRLLDDAEYANYANGRKHRYYGGFVEQSPAILRPPRPGHWHVVIDLGGYAGTIRASVQAIRGQRAGGTTAAGARR